MADPMTGPITHCPWCSATLPSDALEQCPSCGAQLVTHPGAEGDIKGVTALDPEAILRARSELNRPRGRLLSFITGEAPVDMSTPASAEAFAPPPDAVRREIRRLQLEAERADLTAESVALKADELARRGIHLRDLGGLEPTSGLAAEGSGAEGADAADRPAPVAPVGAAPSALPEPPPMPEPAALPEPSPMPEPSADAEVPWPIDDEEPPARG